MTRKSATKSIRSSSEPKSITVPYLFSPRSYQRRVMAAMDSGFKRAISVWHRRSGKDLTWMNQTIKHMLKESFCGTYLHIFPKLTQGRRDLWDAKTSPDSGGRPFRAHFPPDLVMESSETEMQITLRPMPHQKTQPISDGKGGLKYVGSIYQIMGTDKDSIENLRGINAAGVVFSEYADQDPAAWSSIIEPVLLENGGWAAFDFTPKGKNHAHDLYKASQQNPDEWFNEILTIEDTTRDAPGESGKPVISKEQIESLRARGVAEEVIQQEYYCSFEGYMHGSIYGDLIKKAKTDGRVKTVPWIASMPVGIMIDIGSTEATSIWFYQILGPEIRFIDYYSNIKQGADHYAKILREKPYLYGLIILPQDARVKGYTAVENTEEFFKRTVCRNTKIAPKPNIQTGIDMVRRMFSRFTFDEIKCNMSLNPTVPSGLESLISYRRPWNDELETYAGDPVHDKFSHGADALRTGIVGWEDGLTFFGETVGQLKVESFFDPRIIVPTLKQTEVYGEKNV